IQVAQGNLKDAIISTQVATQMSPQSPLLFFQLGLLQYNAKNYASSTETLERALTLTPEYANAKYFLGLSYVRMNRIADAIAIFTDLAKTNPDNKEISFILTNLEAGKSPFADAKPPVTSTPEKRATLPVKEKKQ
ncbi:MAG: tetratricopeptide repeat protein, partial [Patescibacteria group bacterium]